MEFEDQLTEDCGGDCGRCQQCDARLVEYYWAEQQYWEETGGKEEAVKSHTQGLTDIPF